MADFSPFTVGVVAVFVVIAAITDLRHFRVPNLLTVLMLVSGITYHTIAGNGPAWSLLGALCGFCILFWAYPLGAMGAGDVKLMAGVGAWLGVMPTIYVFGVAAGATACYSLVVLFWQGRLMQAIIRIQLSLFQLKTVAKHLGAEERVEAVVKSKDRRMRLVPFAAMIALGVVVVFANHLAQ